MFVTLFLTMETAELSFIKGVNFPISFCSSSHLSCSFPPHTPPRTLPLCRCFPCVRFCFPGSTTIRLLPPCSCASSSPAHSQQLAPLLYSAVPPCLLKSRHPSSPKYLACLSPPCLQVLLAISGFAGNKNRN